MMEKEREILNRVKKYIMDVAWPYVVEHKGSFCTYEIEEIELSEEEKCHIISEWNVVFYPDQEESYGHLNCFIALFKTGEIGFFRKTKEQWLEEAISHYKAEQYERTLCACEQILKLDSNNTRAYHGKGLSLLKLGCVKNALTIYEQVIKIAPNKAETYYYEAGNILCELGQFQEALAVYNQVLKLNPRNDKACVAKGYMLLELERYEEVFAACKQAIQINSSNINDYKNIASTLKYMGRHEEALIAYTHLIPFMPNDYDLHFQRSFLLFKLFKLEEALKSIEKSISINPTSHAYCMYGDIFFDLKRYKEALAAYEKSIDFIDTSDNVYYTMKISVISSDHYENLISSYQRFIEFEKCCDSIQEAYNRLGSLFYKLKRYEDALAIYNKAYTLNARSYYEKGYILFNFHSYEEALAAFKASINLDVRNADAWRMKGDILKLLDRPDASSIHYKVAEIVASWDGDIRQLKQLISQLATAYTKNLI